MTQRLGPSIVTMVTLWWPSATEEFQQSTRIGVPGGRQRVAARGYATPSPRGCMPSLTCCPMVGGCTFLMDGVHWPYKRSCTPPRMTTLTCLLASYPRQIMIRRLLRLISAAERWTSPCPSKGCHSHWERHLMRFGTWPRPRPSTTLQVRTAQVVVGLST